jgi:hypothetical protein
VSFDVGDVASVDYTLKVAGVLTDATIAVTVTAPDGTVSHPSATHNSPGSYTATFAVDQAGTWQYVFTASGAATDVERGNVQVYAAGLIQIADVRARLNKSLTVDDDEIRDMIRAAEAEYAEWVAPIGSVTETFSGGTDRLVLRAPSVTEITEAAYTDGTTIDVDDLLVDNGIVSWGYGTAGYFTWGTRNVTLTYTAADIPAHHRETIIADVAGYFEATQRGPLGPDDTGYANAYTATPTVLFPRIRALAPPSVA